MMLGAKMLKHEGYAIDLVRQLRKNGRKLALAESCTGGLIASTITDLPGASEVFVESLVTYANTAKMARLGVLESTLQNVGAVSTECVKEMALGVLKRSEADLALSVSGIAGPTGGSGDKPVGTVYLAIAEAGKSQARRFHFFGDRKSVREQTVDNAILWLIEFLDGKG